jgi:hypothetical protein
MATARTIVEAALREIGVLAEGETATASQADQALARLNLYIDSLGNERLAIYTVTRSTWTIVSGTQNYLVGSGAAINIARPNLPNITAVQYVDLGTNLEMPMRKLTEDEYAGLRQKAQESTYPLAWYYNPTFPSGRLHFWPIPTSATLLGVIYHAEAVTQLASLDTAISMPPGYQEMLTTQLALLLCPTYERQPHPILVKRAADVRAAVKRTNVRPEEMTFDAGALQGSGHGSYSILEG